MTSVAVAEKSKLRMEKTKKLTMAAMSVALMYLALLAVQYSPTGDAFFFSVAAVVLMLLCLLAGWRWALLAFAALAALSFSTLGPALIWPFFTAYGLWVFLKMAIEWLCFRRNWPAKVDWGLKTLAAIAFSLLARFFLSELLLGQASHALSLKLGALAQLWPIALVLLILLYDYFLSLAKQVLVARLLPYIRKEWAR